MVSRASRASILYLCYLCVFSSGVAHSDSKALCLAKVYETLQAQNVEVTLTSQELIGALRESYRDMGMTFTEVDKARVIGMEKLKPIFDTGLVHEAIIQELQSRGFSRPKEFAGALDMIAGLNGDLSLELIEKVTERIAGILNEDVSLSDLKKQIEIGKKFGMSPNQMGKLLREWKKIYSSDPEFEELKAVLLTMLYQDRPELIAKLRQRRNWRAHISHWFSTPPEMPALTQKKVEITSRATAELVEGHEAIKLKDFFPKLIASPLSERKLLLARYYDKLTATQLDFFLNSKDELLVSALTSDLKSKMTERLRELRSYSDQLRTLVVKKRHLEISIEEAASIGKIHRNRIMPLDQHIKEINKSDALRIKEVRKELDTRVAQKAKAEENEILVLRKIIKEMEDKISTGKYEIDSSPAANAARVQIQAIEAEIEKTRAIPRIVPATSEALALNLKTALAPQELAAWLHQSGTDLARAFVRDVYPQLSSEQLEEFLISPLSHEIPKEERLAVKKRFERMKQTAAMHEEINLAQSRLKAMAVSNETRAVRSELNGVDAEIAEKNSKNKLSQKEVDFIDDYLHRRVDKLDINSRWVDFWEIFNNHWKKMDSDQFLKYAKALTDLILLSDHRKYLQKTIAALDFIHQRAILKNLDLEKLTELKAYIKKEIELKVERNGYFVPGAYETFLASNWEPKSIAEDPELSVLEHKRTLLIKNLEDAQSRAASLPETSESKALKSKLDDLKSRYHDDLVELEREKGIWTGEGRHLEARIEELNSQKKQLEIELKLLQGHHANSEEARYQEEIQKLRIQIEEKKRAHQLAATEAQRIIEAWHQDAMAQSSANEAQVRANYSTEQAAHQAALSTQEKKANQLRHDLNETEAQLEALQYSLRTNTRATQPSSRSRVNLPSRIATEPDSAPTEEVEIEEEAQSPGANRMRHR